MPHHPDTRAKAIFDEVFDLDAAERSVRLAGLCGADDAVRGRVEALLAAAEADGPFLAAATALAPDEEGPGGSIGPYRLVRRLGEGGFGTVFLAEQAHPVRRRVALKVVKPGMDTRQVIARFDAERHTLSRLDHPGIARVLDAGATRSGRPFFVMDLVEGEPITDYCDRRGVPVRERLRLFAQVCRAVQHAHTKGVIHRDVKPGNVLVVEGDGGPVAKVIDFGIAKAVQPDHPEQTALTEMGVFIGTPEYMSPEQAAGSPDVDTRSDVYSLGALLYTLLTGVTPLDVSRLRAAGLAEVQRLIREVDPPRPSTRLSSLAAAAPAPQPVSEPPSTLDAVARARQTDPRTLHRTVKGELDWIVMRALEKDRARRYQSPGALEADVERFLSGQAVVAAPPSRAYRARMFVRRHRASVSAAAVLAAAIVLGLAGTTAFAVRESRARARAVDAERRATAGLAEAEKARAEAERFNRIAVAVSDFFTLDVLAFSPSGPRPSSITLRQVLDAIPEKIKNLKADPAAEGIIRERVGQVYLNLGEPRTAAAFLVSGAELLEKGLGPESRRTLAALQRLGELEFDLENYPAAEDRFDAVYQRRLAAIGPDDIFTINSLQRRGGARVLAGKVEEGLADMRRADAEFVRVAGATSRQVFVTRKRLISGLLAAGQHDDAERLTRAALVTIAQNPAELGPGENGYRMLLAEILLTRGRCDEALAEYDRLSDWASRERDPNNRDALAVRTGRARSLACVGRPAEAVPELEASYALTEPAYGADSPQCRRLARWIADAATAAGDGATAERYRTRR